LSFDLKTGAVRAMVGGSDFTKSQFNRAMQSYRQVGSTFKPIVYAAAIDSSKVTSATMVTDAPLAFATNSDFIWKPANYGLEYEGNMTLRQALAGSKNTCTVRVLESIDPGMNDDIIYSFARKLGIGGPPSHLLGEDHLAKPDNDKLCPWIREKEDFQICMDRWPAKDPSISNTRHRQLMGPDDVYMCRACDMSMGLGSASLTMVELMRAYSAFPSQGKLVEPYFIEEVRDRNGNILETHQPAEHKQVIDPQVASVTTWLLQNVVQGGTGYAAKKALKMKGLAGKTGTTNDEKDTWFVGFTPEVITAAWVGFDKPRSLGISSTGGRTALPIWIEVMRQAAPLEDDRDFSFHRDLQWAQIDEETGRRVTSGGRRYPFVRGTAPESTGIAAGQLSLQDLGTEL
jgi:penicillin-binding protein 1A